MQIYVINEKPVTFHLSSGFYKYQNGINFKSQIVKWTELPDMFSFLEMQHQKKSLPDQRCVGLAL